MGINFLGWSKTYVDAGTGEIVVDTDSTRRAGFGDDGVGDDGEFEGGEARFSNVPRTRVKTLTTPTISFDDPDCSLIQATQVHWYKACCIHAMPTTGIVGWIVTCAGW